jgi:hypothetical protein
MTGRGAGPDGGAAGDSDAGGKCHEYGTNHDAVGRSIGAEDAIEASEEPGRGEGQADADQDGARPRGAHGRRRGGGAWVGCGQEALGRPRAEGLFRDGGFDEVGGFPCGAALAVAVATPGASCRVSSSCPRRHP